MKNQLLVLLAIVILLLITGCSQVNLTVREKQKEVEKPESSEIEICGGLGNCCITAEPGKIYCGKPSLKCDTQSNKCVCADDFELNPSTQTCEKKPEEIKKVEIKPTCGQYQQNCCQEQGKECDLSKDLICRDTDNPLIKQCNCPDNLNWNKTSQRCEKKPVELKPAIATCGKEGLPACSSSEELIFLIVGEKKEIPLSQGEYYSAILASVTIKDGKKIALIKYNPGTDQEFQLETPIGSSVSGLPENQEFNLIKFDEKEKTLTINVIKPMPKDTLPCEKGLGFSADDNTCRKCGALEEPCCIELNNDGNAERKCGIGMMCNLKNKCIETVDLCKTEFGITDPKIKYCAFGEKMTLKIGEKLQINERKVTLRLIGNEKAAFDIVGTYFSCDGVVDNKCLYETKGKTSANKELDSELGFDILLTKVNAANDEVTISAKSFDTCKTALTYERNTCNSSCSEHDDVNCCYSRGNVWDSSTQRCIKHSRQSCEKALCNLNEIDGCVPEKCSTNDADSCVKGTNCLLQKVIVRKEGDTTRFDYSKEKECFGTGTTHPVLTNLICDPRKNKFGWTETEFEITKKEGVCQPYILNGDPRTKLNFVFISDDLANPEIELPKLVDEAVGYFPEKKKFEIVKSNPTEISIFKVEDEETDFLTTELSIGETVKVSENFEFILLDVVYPSSISSGKVAMRLSFTSEPGPVVSIGPPGSTTEIIDNDQKYRMTLVSITPGVGGKNLAKINLKLIKSTETLLEKLDYESTYHLYKLNDVELIRFYKDEKTSQVVVYYTQPKSKDKDDPLTDTTLASDRLAVGDARIFKLLNGQKIKTRVDKLDKIEEKKTLPGLMELSPLKENREKFNFYYLKENVKVCGDLPPGETYGMIPCDLVKALRTAMKNCPAADYAAVVSKNSKARAYAQGFTRTYMITNKDPASVHSHEFGHTFGGLDDEYLEDAADIELQTKTQIEKCKGTKDEANCIKEAQESLKLFDNGVKENSVNCDVSPTCEKWKDLTNGCFKGCRYSLRYFRPAEESLMRAYFKLEFNEPSIVHIQKLFKDYEARLR